MSTKLKIGTAIFLVMLACAWLLYPTSPPLQVVRLSSPAAVDDITRSIGSKERPGATDVVQPIESEKKPSVLEALFGGRFASPATVRVVGSLQTYEGGHGWRGNIFGDIRKGMDCLEQQASKGTPK